MVVLLLVRGQGLFLGHVLPLLLPSLTFKLLVQKLLLQHMPLLFILLHQANILIEAISQQFSHPFKHFGGQVDRDSVLADVL
mmetsp:Transcript_28103/g.27106  ORF Transcript_28103/g.27106 Transcript_28103/m.27106 type:complete len:82 (-) Transcript_28103:173-418(-)